MDDLDVQSKGNSLKLKRLTPEQVRRIDEFLASVGDYGEVNLVVQNGELRYINKLVSFKATATTEKRKEQ